MRRKRDHWIYRVDHPEAWPGTVMVGPFTYEEADVALRIKDGIEGEEWEFWTLFEMRTNLHDRDFDALVWPEGYKNGVKIRKREKRMDWYLTTEQDPWATSVIHGPFETVAEAESAGVLLGWEWHNITVFSPEKGETSDGIAIRRMDDMWQRMREWKWEKQRDSKRTDHPSKD
jgi:hypothetical protein